MLSARGFWIAVLGCCSVWTAAATDPYCPAFPSDTRARWKAAEARLRAYHRFSDERTKTQASRAAQHSKAADSGNLIDQYIFAKMDADGVPPATLAAA